MCLFLDRPGAPFHRRFSMATQRLLESGLVTFWMDDVIDNHVRKERLKKVESSMSGLQLSFTSVGNSRTLLLVENKCSILAEDYAEVFDDLSLTSFQFTGINSRRAVPPFFLNNLQTKSTSLLHTSLKKSLPPVSRRYFL